MFKKNGSTFLKREKITLRIVNFVQFNNFFKLKYYENPSIEHSNPTVFGIFFKQKQWEHSKRKYANF